MIQVDEKEKIRRLYFIKRHSIRQIAREHHYARKTVRKAISDASVSEYHLTKPKPCPVTGPFLPIIERWLEEDKHRPKKQRHTAHRIYARLVDEYGFTGGERTVRQHVSRLKQNFTEVAIPLEFDPGADAQSDWGEAQVYLDGKLVTAQIFCMKLSYSGKPFVMAFPTQRQESFLEGQRRAFEWFEGVPARISYDNLTTAVLRVLRGRNRIEQDAFIAFRSHYLFQSHFATPATPREQGRVENLVGYMRRNYFVPVPRMASFEELNQMLIRRLQEDNNRMSPGKPVTIGEAWEEEKTKLLSLPPFPYRCCVSRPVKANHYSLVSFDGNRYSVPVEYQGSRLVLHAYAWKIEVGCGDRIIASHQRRYEKGQDTMEIDHYLPLLLKRPGAFPYARPVRQWQMPEVYRDFLQAISLRHNGDSPRLFLQVLYLGRHWGRENLEEAMRQALQENRADAERVRQLLLSDDSEPVPGKTGYLEQAKVVLPDLSKFDLLRAAGAGKVANDVQ
jgi:transposase